MTRKEARIRLIKKREELMHKYMPKEELEVLTMAIEALKQVTGKLNNPDDSLLTEDSEERKEQKSKLDLISRAEAIEAIELVEWYHQNKNKDMVSGANDDKHQAWYKAADVYKALEAVPPADRQRGEWKVRHPKPFFLCECSVCGESEEWMSKFCPNCGADMRGDTK